MQYEIIIAGFGGQGILSAGRVLAQAGMMEGKNVSWLPSYGPEMRGGTANCHVILSDDAIGSPIIEKSDILIAMTLPAYQKFEPTVKQDGLILADEDMVKKQDADTQKNILFLHAMNIAKNKNYAYMVLLGKLISQTGILKAQSIEKALYEMLPKEKHGMIDKEMEVLKKGMEG